MDFFYMQDLISIVNHYIKNNSILFSNIDLSYEKSYKLSEIAGFINNLDEYNVPILIMEKEPNSHYCTSHPCILDYKGINFIGLKQGIINTYNKLKNEY